MRNDGIVGEDIYRVIVNYHELLKQLDEPFPKDFVLQEVIEEHEPSSFRAEPGDPKQPEELDHDELLQQNRAPSTESTPEPGPDADAAPEEAPPPSEPETPDDTTAEDSTTPDAA